MVKWRKGGSSIDCFNLAWALFVLLLSTLVCCQPTELIWGGVEFFFTSPPPQTLLGCTITRSPRSAPPTSCLRAGSLVTVLTLKSPITPITRMRMMRRTRNQRETLEEPLPNHESAQLMHSLLFLFFVFLVYLLCVFYYYYCLLLNLHHFEMCLFWAYVCGGGDSVFRNVLVRRQHITSSTWDSQYGNSIVLKRIPSQ